MNFDDRAKIWDDERKIKQAKFTAEEMIKTIDINSEWDALEIGCGTGLISFNLYDRLNHITLFDASNNMIEIVHSKMKQKQVQNMTAFQSTIDDFPVENNKFNLIYISMVLHHIINFTPILEKINKMLKPGGIFCIIDLDEEDGAFHHFADDFHGHNGFDQDELKKAMEQSGFLNVSSHSFFKGRRETESTSIEYSLFIMTGTK